MPLDFDKVKALPWSELASLALCEFSRFVDAIERIAPDAAQLQAPAEAAAAPPTCPCPPELRQKNPAVMGEPVSYRCGLCGAPVGQPVEA